MTKYGIIFNAIYEKEGPIMELIYRVKKPETIQRFIKENHIPTSILERTDKYYKIYVNDQIKSRKDTVRKGDKIHFHIKDEEMDDIVPQNIRLNILYEDEQLLIVNKPANHKMTVSKKHPKNTLANAIVNHYKKNHISAKLHFINRVDTDVSGIVMLAKHRFIKFLLTSKASDDVLFSYQAIVDGEVPYKTFNISLPIGKKEGSILREVCEDGKPCETKYQVLNEFSHYSLMNVDVTQKIPHQIKVHMAHFEFPIVGDKFYNPNTYEVDQILLHNHKVTFTHPISEEKMVVESPLPLVFETFIKSNLS